MEYIFTPPAIASVAIVGRAERFPVHRIYCVGRNYAAHAREMGGDTREAPFFFTKPADAVVADGVAVPYPTMTKDLHHEVELVVAIGTGGSDISADAALNHVYGYAIGVDLTRRDLQAAAKEKGRPWDTAKGFDRSAPISAIQPAAAIGHPDKGHIWLAVNGEVRQEGNLNEMIWNVAEVIAHLSQLYVLHPGDLIYTGTPAGVGPVVRGDEMAGGIDEVGTISNRIV